MAYESDDISDRCLQIVDPLIVEYIRRRDERPGVDRREQPTVEDGGDPYDPSNKLPYMPPPDPAECPRGVEYLEF